MDWIKQMLSEFAQRYPAFKLDFWVLLGLIGQAMFTMRFLLQWIASEKRKESVIPVSFWYFSLGGGLVLLAYSFHRMDPVFILAYLPGNFIYFRNLYFIHRKKKISRSVEKQEGDGEKKK
jgi:lipid-A-disaccharide synthase-like uncharacterized protein